MNKRNLGRIFDKILSFCRRQPADLAAVRALAASLGASINDPFGEGTLLSELYSEGDFYQLEPLLPELTRIFLSCGYDVRANDGMNGRACLSQLCWSSYDGCILEAAELLLDAGADPGSREAADEDSVFSDVAFKLSYWETGEWLTANLFEAYLRMLEAAVCGEDYHGIRDARTCVGKRLTRIDRVGGAAEAPGSDMYILWCEELPLAVTNTAELIVDPRAARRPDRSDISGQFPALIGARISAFLYMDPTAAKLRFEDGSSLLLLSEQAEKQRHLIRMQISGAQDEALPAADSPVDGLFITGDNRYSDDIHTFSEASILIRSRGENRLVYAEGESYTPHTLALQSLGQDRPKRMRRRLAFRSVSFSEALFTREKLTGLHFVCDEKHLYLLAEEFAGITLFLSETPVDHAEINRFSESLPIPFESV